MLLCSRPRWCLSSSQPQSVRLTIKGEAMVVARFTPLSRGRYLLNPSIKNKGGSKERMSLIQIGSRPASYILRWTARPCILYQVWGDRPLSADHDCGYSTFQRFPITSSYMWYRPLHAPYMAELVRTCDSGL